MEKMKIAMANDHAGTQMKEEINDKHCVPVTEL